MTDTCKTTYICSQFVFFDKTHWTMKLNLIQIIIFEVELNTICANCINVTSDANDHLSPVSTIATPLNISVSHVIFFLKNNNNTESEI
jgi:hypothetical protein